uniref:Protein FAR1-RELATED SEQUENCE n=1 Tax=Setaria italica TaxID=4555 RepID=K3Y3L7_SETIT
MEFSTIEEARMFWVTFGGQKDREKGNYKVNDLILEHNHTLHLPQASHLMASQRKISELQGFEIEMANDAEIGPKATHELAYIQNAVKHLAELDDEESDASPKQEVEDNNKEPSILSDFSVCMYEYEDEATFEETFNIMRSKVSKQTWLDSIYKVREK